MGDVMRWVIRIFLGLLLLIAIGLGAVWAFLSDPVIPQEVLLRKYGGGASKFLPLPDGAVAHYRDQGNAQGPALVLLHGNVASLHTWEPWVQLLGDEYRIISVDLPAHGLTGPTPSGDYATAGMTGFVDSFTREIGLTRFVLGGSSMGGGIALTFARDHGARLRGLILVDSAGIALPEMKPPPGLFILQTPVLRDIYRIFPRRPTFKAGLEMTYTDKSLVTPDLIDRYWELNSGPGMRDATIARFSAPWEQLVAEAKAIEASLPSLTTPTLILWGADDKLVPVRAGEILRDKIKGARLIVYPAVGHVPQEEAAEASARDVRAFLQALPGDQ
ncbi:MAG TPA: alpha/beta hydrolase [Alphaproteobacteria bacterium]|nr:alpha/beta hydrolase [Alphaproteobacteria bacterium]HAJ45346.1 alpha/beta hydrolase [Alphaproteobacteria bacterium]